MQDQGRDKTECGECGRIATEGSSFCPSCGSRLPLAAEDSGEERSALQASEEVLETFPAEASGLGAPRELSEFQIEGELSRGGMGVVYRARDPRLDRLVAVKVIAPELANDAKFRKRFLAESRAIASLDNPHILPIYQTGEGDGTLFQVTKFAGGGDLAEEIERRGRMPLEQVAEIVSQIADGLDAAHDKGLIHRDVKPANILIDPPEKAGGRPSYLLSDFGVATSTGGNSGLTETGEVLGTVDYMAPEQIEGREFDHRVDVYALGCVAMELLAGEPPFRRDSKQATMMAHLRDDPVVPSRIEGADPHAVASVFARALAKDPGHRYRTSIEFAEALDEVARGRTVAVPTSSTQALPQSRTSVPRRGRAIVVGLGVVLLLGVGAGTFLYVEDRNNQPDPAPLPEPTPDEPSGLQAGGAPPESAPVEPVPPETQSLETNADSDSYDVSNLYFYSSAEWDDGTTENRYPMIGNQIFDSAVLIEDGTGGDLSPSNFEDVIVPLSDGPFSRFTAKAGLETTYTFETKMNLEFLVTDGTGTDRSVWGPKVLVPGANPVPVSFPLSEDDSRLVIRVSAQVEESEDEYLIIVLGDPTLTG